MVENLPFTAGDVGSIPGRGTKISHALGHLGPFVTTREHVLQLRSDAAKISQLINIFLKKERRIRTHDTQNQIVTYYKTQKKSCFM